MAKIQIPFSLQGMDKFKEILAVLSSPKLEEMFIEESLLYLKERAIYYVNATVGTSEWYVSTGTLANSFEIDTTLKKLYNSCRYSAYVEYGTGIHGDSKDGYVSNVSGKGNSGWIFKTEDGEFHFTHGQYPHRFMFNAVQDYVVGGAYKIIFNQCFEKLLGGLK